MSNDVEYCRVINELKSMILLGKGRWLNDPPVSEGQKFTVDVSVLNNVIIERPDLNKHILIGSLSRPQKYPLLRIKKGILTLSL